MIIMTVNVLNKPEMRHNETRTGSWNKLREDRILIN